MANSSLFVLTPAEGVYVPKVPKPPGANPSAEAPTVPTAATGSTIAAAKPRLNNFFIKYLLFNIALSGVTTYTFIIIHAKCICKSKSFSDFCAF